MTTSTSISMSLPLGSGGLVTVSGSLTAWETAAPIKPKMLRGSDGPIDLIKYPKLGYTRRFNNGSLPSLIGLSTTVAYHVSYNGQPPETTMAAWFKAHTDFHGFITVDHEINTGKKGTPTQYHSDVAWLRQMRDRYSTAKQWPIVTIFGLYAQNNHVAKAIPDYTAYLGTGAEEMLGWDCYTLASDHTYPKMDEFFTPVYGAAGATKLPFMVPELGFVPLGYIPPAQGTSAQDYALGDAYSNAAENLQSHGCVAVAAWDVKGTNNPTQLVLQDSTLGVWREVVAAG
jgi:hypothetical protein